MAVAWWCNVGCQCLTNYTGLPNPHKVGKCIARFHLVDRYGILVGRYKHRVPSFFSFLSPIFSLFPFSPFSLLS
jgi:hypothetical protein